MLEICRNDRSIRSVLHINARIRPRRRTAQQDSLRFFGNRLSRAGLSQKFGTGTLLDGCMVENRKAPHATPDTGEKMTKTPGNLEQPKPATKAEREARKSFRQVDAKAAMTEHETAERAFSNNRERLRAERMAREAVEGPMLYPAPELSDDTPIEKVRLSSRIRNGVLAAGWKTVGEIREASDATLLSLPDLGKGSVSYLRDTLGLPSTDGVRPRGAER
jgi:hypothetical protein